MLIIESVNDIMHVVQNCFGRLELLVVQCPLNCAGEIQVFLNDKDLWSKPNFSEGIFSDLITSGEYFEQ